MRASLPGCTSRKPTRPSRPRRTASCIRRSRPHGATGRSFASTRSPTGASARLQASGRRHRPDRTPTRTTRPGESAQPRPFDHVGPSLSPSSSSIARSARRWAGLALERTSRSSSSARSAIQRAAEPRLENGPSSSLPSSPRTNHWPSAAREADMMRSSGTSPASEEVAQRLAPQRWRQLVGEAVRQAVAEVWPSVIARTMQMVLAPAAVRTAHDHQTMTADAANAHRWVDVLLNLGRCHPALHVPRCRCDHGACGNRLGEERPARWTSPFSLDQPALRHCLVHVDQPSSPSPCTRWEGRAFQRPRAPTNAGGVIGECVDRQLVWRWKAVGRGVGRALVEPVMMRPPTPAVAAVAKAVPRSGS